MRSFSLDGTWELYGSPEVGSPRRQPADLADHSDLWVTGQVPGNVELDSFGLASSPIPSSGTTSKDCSLTSFMSGGISVSSTLRRCG